MSKENPSPDDGDAPATPLRRGWTTGACATAAAKAAYSALLGGGEFPDPVTIRLPGGQEPAFALAIHGMEGERAFAGIVKDAGDDPDVTHGALVVVHVGHGPEGAGVLFRAGAGVGTVTRPGLPIPPGEPAINPVPRRMISEAIAGVAARFGASGDVIVEVSIADGAELAGKTLNPRLGIVGGLSVLGTTGIVIPFSCSAWIHSIHRGIDVARASGLTHIAGSTGSTSEAAVAKLYGLPEVALIDMGDFVGGMLKYVRAHPVERVTIAGGFAKMVKLGQGLLDLHSARGEVDLNWLADLAARSGADQTLADAIRSANSALHGLMLCREVGFAIGDHVARAALVTAAKAVAGSGIMLDVVVFDREGQPTGRA
ncbi:MAG: cobalt-precorrin-5B (C(1))-methyltransferase [Parvibaculaceae bacterium]|nr:cobalt-precorrin-5B (C(1))-methyltransferase [Parvibaculaceae bacterium]